MQNYLPSVLIVDDSRVMRLNLKILVQRFLGQVKIREASALDEALNVTEHYRPDFATIDLNLSGDSGMDLVISLIDKGLNPRCIILITANEMPEIMTQCESLGITYLCKLEYLDEREDFLIKLEDFFKMRPLT